MSVLIKGMKKPDNCEICPYAFCHLDTRNCPIVELPDHGDLIDREALREKAHKLPNGYNHGYFHKCVDELFDYAPAVIPAERSEDE